ncbi:chromatin binding protein [Steccherinum ochraceum]|uniref:Chromatin binding protein n=1 Tax=Steccherinum ochraceum TaxID=92696 RepID=A0A4R0R5A8_9APHY|nr:chromatin binding protein [Steccherinum ochraceum]
MNANLPNPFNITYPTAVQTSLHSQASFARFDPTGRFVAAGLPNGSARIWDLGTKSTVRWLDGHVKGVTSVDWSKHSRYVLTSSKDWNVIVWDIASDTDPPRRVTTVRFDAPVTSAAFHPRNSQILLVLLSIGEAYIVDLRKEHRGRFELFEPADDAMDAESSRHRAAMTVARFDPSGRHAFVGTSNGYVLVFNTRTKSLVARHKINGAGIMKGLDFAKGGRRLATNSSDRTLRQFNLPFYSSSQTTILESELEPTYRFTDPINKVAWHTMSYSPDGEWLAGGAADNAAHKIYVWDIVNEGQFAATLDGGREPLIHVHWHPNKPTIASTTNQGNILIWHCPTPERWGAFAGGFEEVDENVEYEEREDEFDIEDESVVLARQQATEDEPVDILSRTPQSSPTITRATLNGTDEDEDNHWASEEPDEDYAGWKMKVLMEDEEDA